MNGILKAGITLLAGVTTLGIVNHIRKREQTVDDSFRATMVDIARVQRTADCANSVAQKIDERVCSIDDVLHALRKDVDTLRKELKETKASNSSRKNNGNTDKA